MAFSLFSIGKTVLAKLGPLAQQETSLLWNLPTELEKLSSMVTAIHALLLDAEEKQDHNHQIKNWLEKLSVLLLDAEDLLDHVATEALRREAASGDRDGGDDSNFRIHCRTGVCFLFSLPSRLIYGLVMAHKVKSLRLKLDALHDDNTKLNLSTRTEEKGKMRKHTPTISSIPNIVIGREDDLKKIKNLLLLVDNFSSSDAIPVISIIGIGGMGKTALAQLIYNDREIKEEFELRLWVCVSEAFEVNVIIQKIVESARKQKPQDLELDTLIHLLDGEISGKRYLLVLDDVWNFVPEKWDVLRSVLKRGAMGSKILVTTRFENYASMMSCGSPPPYTLSGLSSPQSWSLLCQVAFGELDEQKQLNIINAEEIKTEIMKKSAGVPLAVKTIANLLHFKSPQTEWLPFLRSNKLLDAKHEGSILHNLKLSYDNLPSHLKQCFQHCCLFPRGVDIDVELLIFQWVVHGFIKSSQDDSQQSLLDLGLECFMDFSWRSFFQEIVRDDIGNLLSCRMHDLIYDLGVSIVGSRYKHITRFTDCITEKTYHISIEHDFWTPLEFIGHLGNAKRLQTFFTLRKEWYQSGTNWDKTIFELFVSKFRSLRQFTFHSSGMKMLPHHIQDLKHLRFIDLSNNKTMARLPNSITMLQNMQVLVLYGCESLQELPRDITKLVNLWQLNCRFCFALTHMPVGISKLTRLETLTWFVVGKEDNSTSKHMGGLDELLDLNNLRGLLNLANLSRLRGGKLRLSPASHAYRIGAAANLKGKLLLDELIL